MKIVNQMAKVLVPESPMKHIERIGRICYKSENKVGDGTDRKFIKMLFNRQHHAMLEHYRFIMQVNPIIYGELSRIAPKHMEFSSCGDRLIISFNARAFINLVDTCRGVMFGYLPMAVKSVRDELINHIVRRYDCYELFGMDRGITPPLLSTGIEFIKNDPSAMSKEEWKIHGWASIHMITDRGITHEIVRHREETSFAQESTRYCNYSNDKFGNEITVIDQGFTGSALIKWNVAIKKCEDKYLELLHYGIKPEMARSVLPTCLKTEIVMTAPMYELEHFFNLRMFGTAGTPHPMMEKLATMAYNEIKEVFQYESDESDKN